MRDFCNSSHFGSFIYVFHRDSGSWGGAFAPQILADQLTLSQPGRADYAYHIKVGNKYRPFTFSDLPPWVNYFSETWRENKIETQMKNKQTK